MLIRFIIACFIISIATPFTHAQTSQDSVSQIIAKTALQQEYSSSSFVVPALYNGKFDYGYSPSMIGIAYYETAEWQKGTVIYQNIRYDNIMMRYDLVKDQLIIRGDRQEYSGVAIALYTPRVSSFSYAGNTFYFFEKNHDSTSMAEGFYREIEKGRVNLYGRYTKVIEEQIDGLVLQRKFYDINRFYIVENGIYREVHKKKSLLNLLKERKKDIQSHWRSMGIIFRKQTEQAIITAVQVYNQNEK